ncbi:MAG: hypothetical protein AAF519_00565, partial [Bacteroidota bacterium]
MLTKKLIPFIFLTVLSVNSLSQTCAPPTLGDTRAYIRTFDIERRRIFFEVGVQYTFFVAILIRDEDFDLPVIDRYEWKLNGDPVPSEGGRALTLVMPPLANGPNLLEAIPLNDCGEANEDEPPVARLIYVNNPCEPDVALVRSSSGSICADGSTAYAFEIQNTSETFTWEVDNGANITPSDTQADVVFVNSGSHTIKATSTTNAGCQYTLDIEAQNGPDIMSSVEGVLQTCQSVTLPYAVVGSADASLFEWSLPAGIDISYLNAQQREAELTFNSQGTFTIGVTPVNDCGTGTPYDVIVNVEENLSVESSFEFNHALLQTNPIDELVLNTCEQRTSDCRAQLDAVELRIGLDLGQEYQWGETDFAIAVDFTVTGTGTAGDLVSRNESIRINTEQPEALFTLDLDENLTSLRKFTIQVDNYTVSGGVDNYVRFWATYHDHYQIDVDHTQLSAFNTQVLPGSGWDVAFTWSSSCNLVGDYQFRLLKVFEGETLPTSTSDRWKDALEIESKSIGANLTMAEGSGQYAWQVRAVGNQSGGSNNPENLSVWPNEVQMFTFTQPDEDKNYIYSRTFTEGNRVSEQLTFADGLQRVNQQQTRLNSSNQVVATQTLQDFTGRDAIQSLPAPVVGKSTLGYEPNLMTDGSALYSAESFDTDTKAESPDAAYLDKKPGDSGYYGGMDNGINAKVADAEGVPYTRSLFMNDGTGRLRRQGGVGAAHGIGSPHTVRYFYTGVAQQELDFMFGSEAPVAANTYKGLTVDPNNTTSVTYQNKDGKTIATALVIGTGNTNLDGLDSRDDATRTITENVTEKAPLNENTSSSKKPLVFTLPSGINVNYTLSPATINDVCNSTCKTCDYVVTFILHDMEDPANTRQLAAYTINADAVDCASSTTYARSFTESVEAGSYMLEKRVQSLNRSSVTGNLFIDDHLAEVRGHYTSEIAAVFNPVDAYIRGETIDLDGLYSYLDIQGYNKIEPGDQESYYEVPVGCDGEVFIIPVLIDDCDQEVDCTDLTTQDFVAYFLDYWDAEIDRGPVIDIRLPDPRRVVDVEGEQTYEWLAFSYNPARDPIYLTGNEFNTMMGNLLQELDESSQYLYDCQMVWQVWKQQVQNYQFLKGMTLDPEELPDEAEGLTCEYNLIDNFFRTIEIRLKENETPEMPRMIRKEGFYTSIPGDAEKPFLYKLFYYNAADERMNDCMTGYINYYNSLATTTTPCNQANVADQFQCLPFTERQTIHNCIKYGAYNDAGDDPENENLGFMIRQCNEACENKRPAFRQAVIDDIHNQDLYVEGDAFTLELDSVTGIKRPTGDPRDPAVFDIELCEIEAMEEALVDNCFGYCQPAIEEIIVQPGEEGQEDLTTRRISQASIDKIQKVLTAEFDVVVNTTGETACPNEEWDYLNFTNLQHPESLNDIQTSSLLESRSRPNLTAPNDSIYRAISAQIMAAARNRIEQENTRLITQQSAPLQISQTSFNQVPDHIEYMALRDFFEKAGGPGWTNRVGWDYPNWKDPSTVTYADFQGWTGVEVQNGDIVSLGNLLRMEGEISNQVANLSLLDEITFDFTYDDSKPVIPAFIADLPVRAVNLRGFRGSIPDLTNLSDRLETLDIHQCDFEGQSIPIWLDSRFSALTTLALSNCRLSGKIHAGISDIPLLEDLSLTNNQLDAIDSTSRLFNHPHLRYLGLAYNHILSPLPEMKVNDSPLRSLYLTSNEFYGPIPQSFDVLTSLTSLRLGFNDLTQSIPDIFEDMDQLIHLELGGNDLEGAIPESIGSLNLLEALNLSSKIGGDFYFTHLPDLSQLVNVKVLLLSHNRFDQVTLSQIADMTALQLFQAVDAGFTGEIPQELENFNSLSTFFVFGGSEEGSFNKLSGSIPSGIFTLPNLIQFNVGNNELSGPLSIVVKPNLNLGLAGNYYDFGVLENGFTESGSKKTKVFSYSPQKTILGAPPQELIYTPGQSFTIPFTTSGINNLYQWQKFNGVTWIPVGAQTSNSDLFLASTTEATAGIYRAEVTNTIVTGLALYSHPITLTPEINNTCFVNSLCFRFGDPITEIVIPEGFDDYVFEATPFTCEELNTQEIVRTLDFQQNEYISGKVQDFRDDYYAQCADATRVNDNFEVSYDLGYHHYTLYYYDRAGNLMRTVPPLGFNTTDPNLHAMATDYHYNSLGQLVKQNSPDGGETFFYYNDLGQLRFSQNARQAIDGAYSYTLYDNLGRIVEVGESTAGLSTFRSLTNSPDFPQEGSEKTVTVYTETYTGTLTSPQRFLQNRVSYTYLDEDGLDTTMDDRTYTVYSYDPHGNVEWLVQRVPGLEDKVIQYDYDLISGNVLMVSYNPGNADQFYHKYDYDADNRIISVSTSTDGNIWDVDATYEYYPHGPLKTANIGEDNLQQLDYIYTIHGWLKAMNNPEANDGVGTFGKDAFAMAINYYNGDYTNPSDNLGLLTAASGRELFNGNISAWELATHASDDQWVRTGYQYQYDELNRIKDSRFNVYRADAPSTPTFYARGGFHADFNLDANGNLKSLNRNDIEAINFDALTYNYDPGLANNRLMGVSDAVLDTEVHSQDLESQPLDNYTYDEIGNLTHDDQEDMDIDWTVYGKVDALIKGEGGGTKFTYDAAGNRVKKQTIDAFGNVYSTYYVRDASGNIMGTYRSNALGGTPELREVPIYGSDRIGVYTPEGAETNNQAAVENLAADGTVDSYVGVSYELEDGVSLTLQPGFKFEDGVDGTNFSVASAGATSGALPANIYARKPDHKQYELKDHLGNVRAVITDRKQSDTGGGTPQNFTPKIVSASAYYPYGMDIPTVRWQEFTSTATMEPADILLELPEFDNYAEIAGNSEVTISDPVFNHTQTYVNQGPTDVASYSFRLTGQTGKIIGLSKSLKVQAGDKITASVFGKYLMPDGSEDATDIAASLADSFLTTFGITSTQEVATINQFFTDLLGGTLTFTKPDDPSGNNVIAGINCLVFDENFNFVDAGFQLFTAAAVNDHEELALPEYIVPQDGYVFIYTSNESPQVTQVHFDDMEITHEKLVPDEAYNPDLVAYRYGFNGKEKDQMGEWGGLAASSAANASYPVVWINLAGVDEQDGDITQN